MAPPFKGSKQVSKTGVKEYDSFKAPNTKTRIHDDRREPEDRRRYFFPTKPKECAHHTAKSCHPSKVACHVRVRRCFPSRALPRSGSNRCCSQAPSTRRVASGSIFLLSKVYQSRLVSSCRRGRGGARSDVWFGMGGEGGLPGRARARL